jgi:hypothetical protein
VVVVLSVVENVSVTSLVLVATVCKVSVVEEVSVTSLVLVATVCEVSVSVVSVVPVTSLE